MITHPRACGAPGPKAILYGLHRDAHARALGALPRTIWRIAVQHRRIARPARPIQEPLARPAPLSSWQRDVKDTSTVSVDPGGKRSHMVEMFTTVDVGTSLLLDTQARETTKSAQVALGKP